MLTGLGSLGSLTALSSTSLPRLRGKHGSGAVHTPIDHAPGPCSTAGRRRASSQPQPVANASRTGPGVTPPLRRAPKGAGKTRLGGVAKMFGNMTREKAGPLDLKRPQEIQKVLLLSLSQRIPFADYGIRLGGGKAIGGGAGMGGDGSFQVNRTSVM